MEPEIKNCSEGKIYQWALQNEPEIKEEAGMPALMDISKQLIVSTIPDWITLLTGIQILPEINTPQPMR